MPRLKKSEANQLFPASAKQEKALSEEERVRRSRVALTAKLREQRLAKEAADLAAKPVSVKAKRVRAAKPKG